MSKKWALVLSVFQAVCLVVGMWMIRNGRNDGFVISAIGLIIFNRMLK
ncbi:MAG: hypothetical protein LBV67_04490 [Streptococcaceae bacterium]|jgi:hypothetical protein|nr:hypothetical protein [Streptococcaceae bacterium]